MRRIIYPSKGFMGLKSEWQLPKIIRYPNASLPQWLIFRKMSQIMITVSYGKEVLVLDKVCAALIQVKYWEL